MGYRHVDTAQAYDNERAVGEGIAAADVDREDVFLTTKVWRSNLSADDVHRTVRESLDRLDVDAVDLLLIHWPHPRIPVEETLGAMEELRDEGLVRQLGVGNFTRSQLADAIRVADSPIVANQVLYHPYEDQSTLLEFCRDRDVALTAYSPPGVRSSTTRCLPRSASATGRRPPRSRSGGSSTRTASSPSPRPAVVATWRLTAASSTSRSRPRRWRASATVAGASASGSGTGCPR
jgi:diketogulonate reductase-like aldo/keto reductase